MQGGFAFADVHGDDSSDSDRQDSFLKNQMGANGILAVDVVYLNCSNKSELRNPHILRRSLRLGENSFSAHLTFSALSHLGMLRQHAR